MPTNDSQLALTRVSYLCTYCLDIFVFLQANPEITNYLMLKEFTKYVNI